MAVGMSKSMSFPARLRQHGAMRVYLAGPDVFLPDPLARAATLKAICARHGLVGISPLDALDGGDQPDWATLTEAWLATNRVAAVVGSRDDRDKVVAALGPDVERSAASDLRHVVLRELAALPLGASADRSSCITTSRIGSVSDPAAQRRVASRRLAAHRPLGPRSGRRWSFLTGAPALR